MVGPVARISSTLNLSIGTSLNIRTTSSVQQIAKNISSVTHRCQFLQDLELNQDEVREILRQDAELQAFLHIDLPKETVCSPNLKRTVSAPALCMHDEVEQSQHIKNATWVLDLLIKDVQEKRPGANERLIQLLSWLQELVVDPDQTSLALKEKLLLELAENLKEKKFSEEHAPFAVDIVMNGLNKKEMLQLLSSWQFKETIRNASNRCRSCI